ncbi:MAG: TetR family transcriptional regulator [Sandaracinaceae bacterium]|nr:TetR family transcriptional regulator [Sandaracinaceae bacterium]
MQEDRLRKRPTQERSRRRFEAILDAAAELFAAEGLEAVRMEAIAARAGTSIGSLYQYFPDREAIFFALAERVLERSRAAFDALVPVALAERPAWEELLDRAVDGFAATLRDPSLRAVWMHLQLYGEVVEADAALHEEIIERSAELFGGYMPGASEEERRRVATMTVDVVGAVLFMATRRDAARAEAMIEELKVLLRRYLAPYLQQVR